MTSQQTLRKKSVTPSVRQMQAWKHNSLIGHTRMMQVQAEMVSNSETTTSDAKKIAEKIACLAIDLREALNTRIDLPLPET